MYRASLFDAGTAVQIGLDLQPRSAAEARVWGLLGLSCAHLMRNGSSLRGSPMLAFFDRWSLRVIHKNPSGTLGVPPAAHVNASRTSLPDGSLLRPVPCCRRVRSGRRGTSDASVQKW